jgi:hypothetical protein
MSKKVKIFAIIVGIIIVLILAFTYLGKGSSTPASTDTDSDLSSSAGTTNVVSSGGDAVSSDISTADFNTLLANISSINLDTSIFSNPAYMALQDNPVDLGTAVVGRVNPFAPIGTDAPQAASSLSVQTLTPATILSTSAQFGALVSTQSTASTTIVFQYGLDDTVSSTSDPVNVNSDGTALFTATNLTPDTTYYVKAVAVQGSTTATGSLLSFTTAAAPQSQ